MSKYQFGSIVDRDFRLELQRMADYISGMGYTYEESLQKAHDILVEAQQTNDMNENVQQQINTLIAESGTSEAEVLQARIDAEGNEYPVLKDRLDEYDVQLAETVQDYDVTVTVGIGGDYSTVNEAIAALSKKSVKYKETGLNVEIKLLSGFVMAEQVYVENIDLGFITITSEDAEVIVDATNFTNNVSEEGYGSGGLLLESGAAFTGYGNAVLPNIDVLFDLNKSGVSGRTHGIFLIYGAIARIGRKKGFINSRGTGMYVAEGSRLYATEGISRNSSGNNISCFRGAFILFRGGDGTFAGGYGAYLDNSCVMDAAHSDFSNAGEGGVWISVTSIASVLYSKINNSVRSGIQADNGAIVSAAHSEINDSGGRGVFANGATINAKESSILRSGTQGANCTNSGFIDINNSEVTGSGTNGILATYGGTVNATGANVQMGETPNNYDMRIISGGIIYAYDATGGMTVIPNEMAHTGFILSDSVPYDKNPIPLNRGWSGELYGGINSQKQVWLRGDIVVGDNGTGINVASIPANLRPPYPFSFLALSEGKVVPAFSISVSGGMFTRVSDLPTGSIVSINVTYQV